MSKNLLSGDSVIELLVRNEPLVLYGGITEAMGKGSGEARVQRFDVFMNPSIMVERFVLPVSGLSTKALSGHFGRNSHFLGAMRRRAKHGDGDWRSVYHGGPEL